MRQTPKVAMTAAEIETVQRLLAGGSKADEVAVVMGRHLRTIRRVAKHGAELVASRSGTPGPRKPMANEVREVLRAAAVGRRSLRPAHVRAEPWSEDWYEQQQQAFFEAMCREHPECVPSDVARHLPTQGRDSRI